MLRSADSRKNDQRRRAARTKHMDYCHYGINRFGVCLLALALVDEVLSESPVDVGFRTQLPRVESLQSGDASVAPAPAAFLFQIPSQRSPWMRKATLAQPSTPRLTMALRAFQQGKRFSLIPQPSALISSHDVRIRWHLSAVKSAARSGDPETVTDEDRKFMQLSLDLAEKGKGKTFPNPCVGCVLVKDGGIVGQGYHPKAGMPHAEIYALDMAREQARGATAYVTLEPCNHQGRTPPCSEAFVLAGVGRVVVAMVDPNPLVDSQGLHTLRSNKIPVAVMDGALADRALELNQDFVERITNPSPPPSEPPSPFGGDLTLEARAAAAAVQGSLQIGVALKTVTPSDKKVADLAAMALTALRLSQAFPADSLRAPPDLDAAVPDEALLQEVVATVRAHGGEDWSAVDANRVAEALKRLSTSGEPAGGREWMLESLHLEATDGNPPECTTALALHDDTTQVGVLGKSTANPQGCVMAAVKGSGLAYWPLSGHGPLGMSLSQEENRRRCWHQREYAALDSPDSSRADRPLTEGVDYPPWSALVPDLASASAQAPFGHHAPPSDLDRSAIGKYWALAQGFICGLYVASPRSPLHAAGVLCVQESGGSVRDGAGAEVVADAWRLPAEGVLCVGAMAEGALVDALSAALE